MVWGMRKNFPHPLSSYTALQALTVDCCCSRKLGKYWEYCWVVLRCGEWWVWVVRSGHTFWWTNFPTQCAPSNFMMILIQCYLVPAAAVSYWNLVDSGAWQLKYLDCIHKVYVGDQLRILPSVQRAFGPLWVGRYICCCWWGASRCLQTLLWAAVNTSAHVHTLVSLSWCHHSHSRQHIITVCKWNICPYKYSSNVSVE